MEGAWQGCLVEDEGLEEQGASVDGIAFEFAGFLDRCHGFSKSSVRADARFKRTIIEPNCVFSLNAEVL